MIYFLLLSCGIHHDVPLMFQKNCIQLQCDEGHRTWETFATLVLGVWNASKTESSRWGLPSWIHLQVSRKRYDYDGHDRRDREDWHDRRDREERRELEPQWKQENMRKPPNSQTFQEIWRLIIYITFVLLHPDWWLMIHQFQSAFFLMCFF